MSKNITLQNQKNLWGRQTDGTATLTLEPQRADLFLVDLTSASTTIGQVTSTPMPKQYPQFVRSVAFPEVRLKAEPFKRDSIPYNMPATDDPIDPVKITFLLDTYNGTDQSSVCDLLDVWIALSRAGRGDRTGGYTGQHFFTLDASYKVNCRFNIYVSLLRGVPPVSLKTPPATDMIEHTKWVLRNAWCSGYKLTDVTYEDAKMMGVEAVFYVENIERFSPSIQITGTPAALTGNPVPSEPAISSSAVAGLA